MTGQGDGSIRVDDVMAGEADGPVRSYDVLTVADRARVHAFRDTSLPTSAMPHSSLALMK